MYGLRKQLSIGLFILFQIVIHGCANRSVVVNYSQLQVPAEINLKLDNGEKITGIAIKKSNDAITLQKAKSEQELEIKRNQVAEIKRYESILDEKGNLISQQEIRGLKKNKMSTIYTLGGGAISFGGGLLISSLVYRNSDKEFKITNPISIGSGILGAILFNRIGSHRDYEMAVDQAKENRKQLAENQLKKERSKAATIQEQIKAELRARAEIEAEKKKLEKKLKKKKN